MQSTFDQACWGGVSATFACPLIFCTSLYIAVPMVTLGLVWLAFLKSSMMPRAIYAPSSHRVCGRPMFKRVPVRPLSGALRPPLKLVLFTLTHSNRFRMSQSLSRNVNNSAQICLYSTPRLTCSSHESTLRHTHTLSLSHCVGNSTHVTSSHLINNRAT